MAMPSPEKGSPEELVGHGRAGLETQVSVSWFVYAAAERALTDALKGNVWE
jgi:hypothetical protein